MALIAVAASLLLLFLFIRVIYVLLSTGKPVCNLCPSKPVSTLIILGSGGHTAEMMNLLSVLEIDKFSPRSYIAAATDNMSLQKAKVFEQSLAHGRMFELDRGRRAYQTNVEQPGRVVGWPSMASLFPKRYSKYREHKQRC